MREVPHAFPAPGSPRRSPPYGAERNRSVRLQPVEVVGFIHAKLSRLGLDGRNPYTPDAYRRIAEKSGGRPASIDEICETSLRFASANRIEKISAVVVDAAMEPNATGAQQPGEPGAQQPGEPAAQQPGAKTAQPRAASSAARPAGPDRGSAMRVLERLHPESDGTASQAGWPEAPDPEPRRAHAGSVAGYALAAIAAIGAIGAIGAVSASNQRDNLSHALDVMRVSLAGHPSTDVPASAQASAQTERASPADDGFAAPELVAMALDPTDRLATPLLVLLEPGDGHMPGHLFILISGLPDGIVPSHGVDGGDGTWRVDGDEISSLEIRAEPDYAGPGRIDIDVIAVADYGEGRQTTAGETVSVGIRSAVATAERVPPTPSPATAAATRPDPSDTLEIRRGDELFAQGDLAGARLFYERATAEGSVEGALAMGRTHDPLVFERMRVRGLVPDPDQAIAWYRRAAGYGSKDAQEALRALTARGYHHGDSGGGAR
ncbi:MAG TPA: hypothetical protein VK943_19455 [Arenibaculum sp.]|nr:hypothetical protein [Arenibaculum sp.]